MKIRIWGARGSIPTPLKPKEVEGKIFQAIHGMPDIDTDDAEAVWSYIRELPLLLRGTASGNTSCVEIQAAGQTLIIDAGSGLRELGLELMKGPCGQGQGVLHFVFSHLHWDHIQGFPFFMPAFIPGNRLIIHSVHNLKAALTDQQRSLNFPVPLSYMQADMEFVRFKAGTPFSIGQVNINTIRNHHPGDSYSYRFEDQHSVFVYASDSEYKDLDEAKVQAHLEFFKDADALVFDAQYGLRESWESKADWGHSSAMIGIDFARRAGVEKLLLFHHEPTYSDLQLQEIQSTAIAYQAQDTSLPTCEVIVAYEGLTLDLTPPGAVGLQMMPEHETAVLTPTSVFDEQGVDQLARQLAQLATQEVPTGSIIDLSQVERLTTVSLKKLVTLSQQREKGPIVLAAPSHEVEQVIRLGGYADYFAIYQTVEDAITAVQAREALNLPGQTINDQYQIAETLGKGRLGIVLKVTDKKHKRPAALKILSPTFSEEAIDRFARQVQQLLDLTHRNIVRIFDCDWSQDGNHTFIVEELMSSPTLHQYLSKYRQPIPADEALDIALDITLALEYAHSRGTIHGNLKPQDIFLTEEGIKINGFGLGRLQEGKNLLEAPMIFLRASHLAPEQILGRPLDARTDLYALGVIFYQLFTSRLPFTGSDQEVMQAHLDQAPVPPGELNPQISPSVEHLILKLLAKNSNDRYASAQQALRISNSLIVNAEEKASRRRRKLVGRDTQLEALQTCWQKAQTGHGQLVFITGESGIGKTSLAQRAAGQSEPPLLLIGHCEETEGRPACYPFIEALHTYLATASPEFFNQEIRQLLSNCIRLLPEIRQMLPDLPIPPLLEPRQEQLRLMSSLVRFIKLATKEQPWFLIIKDLQWADQSSLELLRYLSDHLPSMALLLVGTYHGVDLEQGHPLRQTLSSLSRRANYHHFSLSHLDQAGVEQVLTNLWRQPAPPSLAERIYKHTNGNPFYIQQVAGGLIDDGLVTWQEGSWHFPTVEEIRLPQSVHETILRRVHHLHPDTQSVLRQAAVLGQTFQVDVLQEISELTHWEVLEYLDPAIERQLVREVSSENWYRFSHAEIRHVIYEDVGSLRRRLLHRQTGQILEQRAQPHPERIADQLAYHFSEAGELKKAITYALQAAQQAQMVYANHGALKWYNRTLEMVDQLDSEDASRFQSQQLSTYRQMGNVLTLMSRWNEADKHYQQALELAERLDDKQARAWCQTAKGKLLWQQGLPAEALAWLEQAHTTFAEFNNQEGLGAVLHQKGAVRVQQGNYKEARTLYEESLAIRRSLGDKVNIANLLNNLGQVHQNLGDYPAARALYEESLSMHKELDASLGIAEVLGQMGGLAALQGQAERALCLFGAAQAQHDAIGSVLPPVEQNRLEQLLDPARQALGKKAAAAAVATGRAWSLEQAIDYALQTE